MNQIPDKGLLKLTIPKIIDMIEMRKFGVPKLIIADEFGVTSGTVTHWTKPGFREKDLVRESKSGNVRARQELEKGDYWEWVRRHPAKTPEDQRKYSENKLKGDRKASKDRGLGHEVLLGMEKAFEIFGVRFLDGHHIDNMYVIYIPRVLHRYCLTGDREGHRAKVIATLKKRYPVIYCSLRQIVR